jgi:hypothetical protein
LPLLENSDIIGEEATAMKRGKIWRRVTRGALAAVAGLGLAGGAWAQVGWNIDLDVPAAPPELGGGVPSSSFAAAGLPGFWNSVTAVNTPPTQLRGLNGDVTGVLLTGPTGGSSLAFNNPLNTGDFSKLLNDARSINPVSTYTFSGLTAGPYILFTYAIPPNNNSQPTAITVNGVTHFTSGSMPGNQFILGRTHVIHEFNVTDGSFSVEIAMVTAPSYLNGFQLQFVPEPTAIVGLTSGLLFLIGRKRRSK